MSYRAVVYLERRYPEQAEPLIAFLTKHQPITHVVGFALLVVAVLALYIPRRRALHIVWPVLRRGHSPSIEVFGGHIISEAEVQAELRRFSTDALEIRIIAGDADFLRERDPQHAEVLSRGPSCKVLLSARHRVPAVTLKKLIDAGVQIRMYPVDSRLDDINLRGRLKRSATGTAACIFDKASTGYRVLNLSNETLMRLVDAEYDEWFRSGRNPLIKHIIIDLGGVAFDGDIYAFYRTVEGNTGISIRATAEDYSLVDADLNLGRCDIVEALSRRLGRPLSDDAGKRVREAWSNTWKINSGMKDLVEALKDSGFTVSVVSNCDQENADLYAVRGDFDVFHRVFLSCEIGLLKPSDAFFQHVLEALEAQAWECVFIEDARISVEKASSLGFHTIYMPRNIEANDKAEYAKRQLEKIHVQLDDDD